MQKEQKKKSKHIDYKKSRKEKKHDVQVNFMTEDCLSEIGVLAFVMSNLSTAREVPPVLQEKSHSFC